MNNNHYDTKTRMNIPHWPGFPDKAYVDGHPEKQFKDAHPEYKGYTEEDFINDGVTVLWKQWLEGPHKGPKTLSLDGAYVLGCTGRRGDMKSLTVATWIAKKLAIGDPVWSNMAVKFYLNDGNDNLTLCETKPLNMDALYRLEKKLNGGAVAISELQYFADARQSNSLKNRLINAAIFQVRKRALSFYFDCKYLTWIDLRIRAELDTEFHCRDFAHTEDGIEHRAPLGILALHEIRDLAGWSGETCGEYDPLRDGTNYFPQSKARGFGGHFGPTPIYEPGVYKQEMYARWAWHIYDTSQVVDFAEIYAGVQIDVPKRVISDRRGDNRSEENIEETKKPRRQRHADLADVFG